jgi:serine/threonine protein kinase
MARVVSGTFDEYVLAEKLPLRGGSGELFAIQGKPRLLYKRFNVAQGDGHTRRIIDLVDVGRQISGRNDFRRARHIAWPVDLEVKNGKVLGVVVPRAGEEYFFPNTTILAPQNFGHLSGSTTMEPPAVRTRLTIARQLAGALDLLDEQDLIHGDVSSGNMLWTLEPEPSLLIVDCDGIRPRGFEVGAIGTPLWRDPRLEQELIPYHDAQSDWYALALAIYRASVLSYHEVPRSDDFGWIEAELPAPIAEKVIQVFADPTDDSARVPPKEWYKTLRKVIDNESEWRQIEAANLSRPATVAARRAAGNSPRRHARKAPGQSGLQGASGQAAGQSAPGTHRSIYNSGYKKRTNGLERSGNSGAKQLFTTVVLLIIAILGLYHFTGLPTWPILNTFNFFLNSSQRNLVANLSSPIYHCEGDTSNLPSGVVAAVLCEWGGHDVVAMKFASVHTMLAFYARREVISTQNRVSASLPHCPKPGHWYKHPDTHALGKMTFFTSSKGARIDWYRNSSLIYTVGFGPPNDLDGLCRWWTALVL